MQLRPQSLHRILGKAQRLDKVIAGAAAGEQKRKPAAGQAVDDLKKRAVATDGDNARHIFFYSCLLYTSEHVRKLPPQVSGRAGDGQVPPPAKFIAAARR